MKIGIVIPTYHEEDNIVELCGDLPRIELFARQKADGWDSWGDQI